jgi:predicted TIM-barrel fold metal-dependent hydrolase
MLVTDAQIHVWEVDRPGRPWPEGQRTPPQLPDGFSAEQAIRAMDEIGVDRAVIVPPSWVGENNATALEAAEAHPGRFAVMGRIDPLAPDTPDRLASWLQQPHMLGIRLTFNFPRMAAWMENITEQESFWEGCERCGIPLMLYLPGAAHRLDPIATRHSGVRFVLDHMARPGNAGGPAAFADLDAMLALARHTNVAVKVSSAPNYSTEPYPYADIHPFLRRIYDAFGPRRMLWGSDLTRLRGSYRECADLFRRALDFLTEEDRGWIMGGAAASFLNWPE